MAPAAQWLRGHQLYEAREAAREDRAQALDAREAMIAAREQEFAPVADDEFLADEHDLLPPDDDLDLDASTVDDVAPAER